MKLQKKAISVGVWSEDYKKLADWYEHILGLERKMSADLPNDSFVAFDIGENWFWVGKHDKIKGKNKDPYRIMFEFYVESVSEVYKDLKEKNVTIIAAPFQDPLDEKNWCLTIQDPEDNILQLYGGK